MEEKRKNQIFKDCINLLLSFSTLIAFLICPYILIVGIFLFSWRMIAASLILFFIFIAICIIIVEKTPDKETEDIDGKEMGLCLSDREGGRTNTAIEEQSPFSLN